MRAVRPGSSKRESDSTRLLSTEELFEGFNEIYESAGSEDEAGSNQTAGSNEETSDHGAIHSTGKLEITDSGDAFNVRAELPSSDSAEALSTAAVALAAPEGAVREPRKVRKKASKVLRAIDMLADADRENITATLKGSMLEVKLPKGRIESLAAARSALLGSAGSGGSGNASSFRRAQSVGPAGRSI